MNLYFSRIAVFTLSILGSIQASNATAIEKKVVKFVPTDSTHHESNGIALISYLTANVATQDGTEISPGFVELISDAITKVDHPSKSLVSAKYDSRSKRMTLSYDGSPGESNEPLVMGMAKTLERCYEGIDDVQSRIAFNNVVEQGVDASSPDLSKAKAAAKKMFAYFSKDGCTAELNVEPNAAMIRVRSQDLTLAVSSVLGVSAHPRFWGGEFYTSLVSVMNDVLLSERGIWIRAQQNEIRGVLVAVLKSSFVSDASMQVISSGKFATFLDLAIKSKAVDPEMTPSSLRPFVEICSGNSVDALFAPFDYSKCSSDKRFNEIRVELAGKGYSTLEE